MDGPTNMKDKSILMRTVVAIIILLFAHTVLAEFKEWTTIDNQTLVWELIAVDGEFATFRTRDGIKLEFHASRLSADSRRAVREWIDERKRQEEARRIIHALETEYGHTDASKIFSSAEIWEWADSQSARINALLDSTEPGDVHIALLEFRNRHQPAPSRPVTQWEVIETSPSSWEAIPPQRPSSLFGLGLGPVIDGIIVAIIIMLVAVGLKRLIWPFITPHTPMDYGRSWASWAVALATMGTLWRFFPDHDEEALFVWILHIVVYGSAAFLLGLIIGAVKSKRRKIANEPDDRTPSE